MMKKKHIFVVGCLVLMLFVLGVERVEAKLKAPKLFPMYPSMLRWKWHDKNPYQWRVYQSLDGGKTYIFVDDYWAWGKDRLFSPDGGSELMYIVGVNQKGKEITRKSNVVRPDDARVLRKKWK